MCPTQSRVGVAYINYAMKTCTLSYRGYRIYSAGPLLVAGIVVSMPDIDIHTFSGD